MANRILVIEDAPEFQLMVKAALSDRFDLTIVSTGKEALERLTQETFDLALIDIVLPDMSGLQISSYIRSQKRINQMGVIMLTSRDTVDDKIAGFDSGADDYITKPFNHRELVARVKSQLRRSEDESRTIYLAGLEIDQDRQRVYVSQDDRTIELTRIEFSLLVTFAQRVDHVLSRQQLLELVWPNELNTTERTVDSHISNLRKKIAGSGLEISAVHGSGYRLSTNLSQAA